MQPEVITWCALNNIVIIPGCQTPTEAYNAYKAGAPVQKIFPGVSSASSRQAAHLCPPRTLSLAPRT